MCLWEMMHSIKTQTGDLVRSLLLILRTGSKQSTLFVKSNSPHSFPLLLTYCLLTKYSTESVSAFGVLRRRSSFQHHRAGHVLQLAFVQTLVRAQPTAVLQHADGDTGDVAWVVQAAVRSALVPHAEILQHAVQPRLGPSHLNNPIRDPHYSDINWRTPTTRFCFPLGI